MVAAELQGHAETGLDYFGGRYFSVVQGRFTSPDPMVHPSESHLGEEGFLSDPQRWNKYAYTRNNPLLYIDPDGRETQTYNDIGSNWNREARRSAPMSRAEKITWATIAAGAAGFAAPEIGAGVAGAARWLAGLVGLGEAGRRTLDILGGRASQVPGAINVDIAAEEGIRQSASAYLSSLKPGTVDEIIASGPYIPGGKGTMDYLPQAAQALKSSGQIIINATANNEFGKLPDAETLKSLGLKVVQQGGPLPSRFANQVFRRTDGSVIPKEKVLTTILEKQ